MNSHNLKVAKKIKDIDEETHYIDLDCIVVKIFPKREHILIDTGLVGDSVDSIVKRKGNGPYDKRHNRSLNIVIADKDNLNSHEKFKNKYFKKRTHANSPFNLKKIVLQFSDQLK